MVKNTTGGNRSKCLARKNESHSFAKLRISESPLELYAIVRKLFGGSICQVFCHDNITRNAIIRGKFSGKNKRNHIIGSGSLLLIGLRDWSSSHDGKVEQCDVLEVYGANEVDLLKQRPDFPIDLLNDSLREMFGDSRSASKTDGFDITTIDEIICDEDTRTESIILIDSGEEISIDEI